MPGVREAFESAMRTHQAGNVQEAARLYREILAVEPQHADARHLLGVISHQQGEHQAAIEAILDAIARNPDFHGYHHNLGCIYLDLGRYNEAVASLRRALQLDASAAESHYNLATALRSIGQLDEAEIACKQALRLKPRYAEARSNLGIVLEEQGRFAEALAAFNEALQMDPNYADAHLNRALLQLLLGNFAAGWREFDWLWKASVAPQQRTFVEPRWQGEPITEQTILLHAEQGLGDTIQFARYVPLLAAAGATVILEVQPELKPVFANVAGVASCHSRGEPLPPYDLYCPLGSLPFAFKTELSSVPADIPYLNADEAHIAKWRPALEILPGKRVALAWAGHVRHANDRNRSIDLRLLETLFSLDGVSLVSIQRELRDGDAQLLHRNAIPDLGPRLADMADTAAVLANVDLVISVDTSVVHLGGAMGREVWALLPFTPDWRWTLEGEHSPWYPRTRLFRQSAPAQWKDVIEAVRDALLRVTSSS